MNSTPVDRRGASPVGSGRCLTTRLPLGAGETRELSFGIEGRSNAFAPHQRGERRLLHGHEIPLVAGRVFNASGFSTMGASSSAGAPQRRSERSHRHERCARKRLSLEPSGRRSPSSASSATCVMWPGLAPSAVLYMPQTVPIDPTRNQVRVGRWRSSSRRPGRRPLPSR